MDKTYEMSLKFTPGAGGFTRQQRLDDFFKQAAAIIAEAAEAERPDQILMSVVLRKA